LFDPEEWAEYESYWMIVDGQIVGCSAFVHDVDYDEQPRSKSLYIISTGILPEFQERGLGRKLKQWQIEYAREHGIDVIVTNMRESNIRITGKTRNLASLPASMLPDTILIPTKAPW
jgi:GNAT superfamily N-acetyltransferase